MSAPQKLPVNSQKDLAPFAGDTTNPFATVLIFYADYRRSKLKPEDLSKIAKKYCSKPAQMMRDLSSKYQLPIPSSAFLDDVRRICVVFNVPESYKKLIPELTDAFEYSEFIDVLSTAFDADVVFQQKRLLAVAKYKSPVYDNMSKLTHLIPNFNGNLPSQHVDKPIEALPQKPKTKSQNILSLIADDSIPQYEADGAKFDSPLSLLYKAMREKSRIHIVVRRFNSVRGWMEGYLRAFDRHFNMILTDVDEHYAVNKTKGALAKLSDEKLRQLQSSKHPLLRRHLPQVMVRGDSVVFVARASAVYRSEKRGKKYSSAKVGGGAVANVHTAGVATIGAGGGGAASVHVTHAPTAGVGLRDKVETEDRYRYNVGSTGTRTGSRSEGGGRPLMVPHSDSHSSHHGPGDFIYGGGEMPSATSVTAVTGLKRGSSIVLQGEHHRGRSNESGCDTDMGRFIRSGSGEGGEGNEEGEEVEVDVQ